MLATDGLGPFRPAEAASAPLLKAMRAGAAPCRPPRAAARGFTLVEVLVALAIVAVALATGIKAAGALTDNAERLAAVSAAAVVRRQPAWSGCACRASSPASATSTSPASSSAAPTAAGWSSRPTPNPDFRSIEARVADANGLPLFSVLTVVWRNQ